MEWNQSIRNKFVSWLSYQFLEEEKKYIFVSQHYGVVFSSSVLLLKFPTDEIIIFKSPYTCNSSDYFCI